MRHIRKKAKSLFASILALTLLLSLVGCGETSSAVSSGTVQAAGDSSGNSKEAVAKVINVGITNDPATVNPLAVNNTGGTSLSKLLFLPLCSLDENLQFVNLLAEDISTENNSVFTVKINQAVKWTDGEPVTADDAIFTLGLITNPVVGAHEPSSYNAILGTDDAGLVPDGGNLEGVKKVDDYTFTIETKYPMTLDIFRMSIASNLRALPKHILENEAPETINQTQFLQAPNVTNGAFLFGKYVAGQYLTFTANPDYFLGAPKIDTLNIKFLTSTQIAAQLESGEVDMNWPLVGNIDYSDYERVRSLDNVRTAEGIPSNVQTLFINSASVDNVKIRQAMSLAIDREGILENLLSGDGYITSTPVTDRIQYWNKEAAEPKYDLEKAKALVEESGWDLSKEIVFSVPTGNTTRERAATIIAENFKAIGLNITIQKADLATTLGNVQNCNYDISIIGMPDVPLNIVRFLRVYAATNYTWTNYSNPRADELVDTIQTSVDDEVIKEAYIELQDLIAEEVPVAGIYSEYALHAVNKRVTYGELKEYGCFVDVEKWDVE